MVSMARDVSSCNNRIRKTPEEIQGFQRMVLTPGGEMEVINVSNGGALVKSRTRMTPGGRVHACVVTADATHEVEARVVRSELTAGEGGISYRLAIEFAEPLALIDSNEVDDATPKTSDIEIPGELLLPRQSEPDLRMARTSNRW